MLFNLPNELLIDIAIYLPIYSKLQLALTCKKFKKVVFDECFYETLNLFDKQLQVDTILNVFMYERSNCLKVKVLKIVLDDALDEWLNLLPFMFCNVVDIHCVSSGQRLRPEDDFNDFIRWKESLKYLKVYESQFAFALCRLLENNVFPCLANLNTTLLQTNGSRIDIWKCTKNAPALESLTLDSLEITLENMESIHSGCPLLSIFKIHSCAILVSKNDTLPEEITPALRLSRLSLSGSAILDQKCLFLLYLTRKYSDLISLEFDPGTSKNVLKDYDLFSTNEVISSPYCDMRTDEQHLTRESYTTSASRILSNLPVTLKQLKITSFNIDTPMIIFSNKCVNITRLELFRWICSSLKDIEMLKCRLPSLRHLAIWIDPTMQDYNQSPVLKSVTHLKIAILGNPLQNEINIGWILSIFPSLNSLDIDWSGVLLIGDQSDPPRVYPNLSKLFIGPSTIDAYFLNYMFIAAPNLKDIGWPVFNALGGKQMDGFELKPMNVCPNESKGLSDRKRYKIDLTGFHLDCFRLNIHTDIFDSSRGTGVILNLMNKDAKRKAFIITEDCLMNYSRHPSTAFIKKQITIQYDHTKKIKINSAMSIDLGNLPID